MHSKSSIGGYTGVRYSFSANLRSGMTPRDISWKAMLGKDEQEATEEEIAALEAEHGPFQPADSEG